MGHSAWAQPDQMYVDGHLGPALDLLRTRIDASVTQGWSVNIAICLLVAAGRYTEALAWARRVISSGEPVDGLFSLAMLLKQLDHHGECREMLQRVLVQDPESESAKHAAELLGVRPSASFAAFFSAAKSDVAAVESK